MTTQKSILDALNDLTAACFPGRTTYRDAWPEQFVRPSLFLVAEARRIVGGSRYTVELEQVFGVQLNDSVSDHYEADTDRLSADTDRLMQALAGGALHVGDRALHIGQVEAVREGEAAVVKLTLHWFEDRPGQAALPPTARSVEITTELKTNGGGSRL